MYTKVECPASGLDRGISLVLAHGAGAPADSPFMEAVALALAGQGVTSIRFEFPYMTKRREDGRKRPPDRQPVLLETFARFVEQVARELAPGRSLFIGGKSMGGRMASVLAASQRLPACVAGAVVFGYPFHPPGKPERVRTDHFASLSRPLFIAQGTRDPFGKAEEFASGIPGGHMARVCWIDGGDHDLKPLSRQRLPADALINQAAAEAAAFMGTVKTTG